MFCCLQFGGMFLGPMMLLMDLTLPWENVLCLTFDCVKQYYMLSILYCITKKFYCTFTVDPLPLFFLFVLSSIYSKLLCPLKIYICLDINWMLIYYLIKCIVKSSSVVEFSILILNRGSTWRSWNWRSRSQARQKHACMTLIVGRHQSLNCFLTKKIKVFSSISSPILSV